MNFVAIDFETANEDRGSACEIGLVRFSGGQAVDRFQSLIYQDYFNPFNVSLHGITEKQVARAPAFDDVWAEAENFKGCFACNCGHSSHFGRWGRTTWNCGSSGSQGRR